MAELTNAESPLVAGSPIPASTQLFAVAWLRWRIFVNSTFRKRPKTTGQALGLVLAILIRIIVWPFLILMVVGPVGGSGYFAWLVMAHHHEQRLQNLLAGITLLWQFVSINGLNIAATVSNFDPASLTRFPLRFGRYLFLRTLIGLLTPSTIVGCLALLAAAIGVSIAQPTLALPALLVLGLYALMNIFLTRMIGAWMERWLANRRFREIFGVFMGLFAVGIQFLNFQRIAVHSHGMPHSWFFRILSADGSYLSWLPPGFAANAILLSSRPFGAAVPFLALLATTVLFVAVFAIRLHKQFLGEHLSEGPVHRSAASSALRAKAVVPSTSASAPANHQTAGAELSPVVSACLRKEWLMLRGNSAQLIGLLTPLIFVILLSRGSFAVHPEMFLPGAIAYVLLGVLAGLYNIFGADGTGVQIYLLAPVRLRDVIVAKNFASLVLITAEAICAWLVVWLLRRSEITLSMNVSTILWTVFVIAINLSLGTLRSIQAPRRFVPGQARQRRGTPTNRTSSLLVLLVLFGSLFLLFPILFLAGYLHEPWLASWIFGPLAIAAIAVYLIMLHNADQLIMKYRDVFTEELCKV